MSPSCVRQLHYNWLAPQTSSLPGRDCKRTKDRNWIQLSLAFTCRCVCILTPFRCVRWPHLASPNDNDYTSLSHCQEHGQRGGRRENTFLFYSYWFNMALVCFNRCVFCFNAESEKSCQSLEQPKSQFRRTEWTCGIASLLGNVYVTEIPFFHCQKNLFSFSVSGTWSNSSRLPWWHAHQEDNASSCSLPAFQPRSWRESRSLSCESRERN